MLEVCSGVTNEKEKDGVHERSDWLQSEGSRVTGYPLCAKCLSVARGLNLEVLSLWTSELGRSNESKWANPQSTCLNWERVHPLLYIKGMALQVSGREYECF